MAKNLILWLIVAVVLMTAMNDFSSPSEPQTLNYSDFIQQVRDGKVERVTVDGYVITGKRSDGDTFKTIRPAIQDNGLIGDLVGNNIVVEGRQPEQQNIWTQLPVASFPILVIIAVLVFFMRQTQGGDGDRGGPMSLGKSKARLLPEDQVKTTFADVAGCDEAKEEVSELVEFLRDPGKFQRLGGRIPRSVLMVSLPGTGKTLLAKAIAGEVKVPFFIISGSDFIEMLVDVDASRVRDMFDQAKKHAPCIIFIDEIDAVGRHRGAGLGGGHDEREQTPNQLLVEMDGFKMNDSIIVIAATNRPDVLDPALLRPGRLDRQMMVGLPDIRGREQILKVHMRKMPLGNHVDPAVIARGTPGLSGADLANLVNEASLFAVRSNKRTVDIREFELAKGKIMMGAGRRTMAMSKKEKRNAAYHGADHAIADRLVSEHDPVYKISIIPHGRALGVTMFLPEGDRYSLSRRAPESQICSLFGGRTAEEMTLDFEGVITGASNDIMRATQLARNMMTKWRLSEKLGPLMYAEEEGEVSPGRSAGSQRANVPGETAKMIDQEVRRIIDDCYGTAKRLLDESHDKLEMMADALMKHETIDSDQIDDIMAGRMPREPRDWQGGSGTGAPPVNLEESDRRENTPLIGGPAGEHWESRMSNPQYPTRLPCGSRVPDLAHPHVMGILNVTPDSFSDGGRCDRLDDTLRHAERMVREGATLIDVGGESTRPGARNVSPTEELERVVPVVEHIVCELDIVIPVDTFTPAAMRETVRFGAGLIDDVRSLQRDGALDAAVDSGLAVCLMHMRGEPQTMQDAPAYQDVVAEVGAFLQECVDACVAVGIDCEWLLLDPGFGFAKTLEHNLALFRHLQAPHDLGLPLLVGVSRKSMIGKVLGREVDERLYGSLALAALALAKGARIIRVHDVVATVDMMRMISATEMTG